MRRRGRAHGRPDRAGLPADGRADRRPPAGRDARGARPGRPRLPRVPAVGHPRRPGSARRSRPRSRRPITRPTSRPATPPCAVSPSTSCSRSSSAWSGGDGPVAATRRPPIASDGDGDAAIRTALTGRPVAQDRPPGDPDRRPGRRDGPGPRRPGPARRRCCACSRATSGRARRRSRRTPWPRPRGPGSRAPSSPRPTCSPASTSTRSVRCWPISGSTSSCWPARSRRAERTRALEAIASGQASVVVGTHALFQEAVTFARLGLAVIDEQHRFGVEQRGQLEAKAGGLAPHVLLMTATPIPRTLGQVLYADLDVSDLRTPPAGRIADPDRDPARRTTSTGRGRGSGPRRPPGHRTFVVVPLIEEGSEGVDDALGSSAVAAETEAVRLTELPRPAAGRPGPRSAQAGRSRRRDAALPRRRPGRARGHDRRRGRGRRPGGDDDDRPGRRPVRVGPAPPAPRPGRSRHGGVVLRPRLGRDRRDGPGATQGRRRAVRRVRAGRARLRAASRG